MHTRTITRPSRRGIALLGAAALLLLGAVACTPEVTVQQAAPGEQTGITVAGTGRVSVQPDVAIIDLGVEANGDTVAETRDAAATAAEALRQAVIDEGVAEEDIQTRSLNIHPQYVWSEDEAPRITGYTVSSFIEVKVREIDNASAVLDAAVAASGDAARVNGIRFTVDDPEEHLANARTAAIDEARAHAETLAQAAGVTLGGARSITESASGGAPPPMFASGDDARAEEAAALPVDPGEQELTVMVSVVYDIEP